MMIGSIDIYYVAWAEAGGVTRLLTRASQSLSQKFIHPKQDNGLPLVHHCEDAFRRPFNARVFWVKLLKCDSLRRDSFSYEHGLLCAYIGVGIFEIDIFFFIIIMSANFVLKGGGEKYFLQRSNACLILCPWRENVRERDAPLWEIRRREPNFFIRRFITMRWDDWTNYNMLSKIHAHGMEMRPRSSDPSLPPPSLETKMEHHFRFLLGAPESWCDLGSETCTRFIISN